MRARWIVAAALVLVVLVAGASLVIPHPRSTPTRPIALFIGDSYTTGYYATRPENRWSSLVAKREDWIELNLGRPGTGYTTRVTGSRCGYASCPVYAAEIPIAARIKPDIVVVAGGLNDWKTPISTERTAVKTFYEQLRADLPDARLIVLGPNATGAVLTAFYSAQDVAVNAAAKQADATFIDMLHPNVLSRSDIGQDGIHPTDSGHAAIAERVLAALGTR